MATNARDRSNDRSFQSRLGWTGEIIYTGLHLPDVNSESKVLRHILIITETVMCERSIGGDINFKTQRLS